MEANTMKHIQENPTVLLKHIKENFKNVEPSKREFNLFTSKVNSKLPVKTNPTDYISLTTIEGYTISTTDYNRIKNYIESFISIEDLISVNLSYGSVLPGSYKIILTFNRELGNDTTLKLKEHFITVEEGTHYKLPMYEVVDGKGIVETGDYVDVKFVRGSKLGTEDVAKRIGTLHEHLLSMMISDLQFKNGLVRSREGSLIITKLQEARNWMRERTIERQKRGVLGTYKK